MTHLFVAFSAEDNERGKGGKCECKDENEAEEEPQTRVEVSEEEKLLLSRDKNCGRRRRKNSLGPPVVCLRGELFLFCSFLADPNLIFCTPWTLLQRKVSIW